MIPSPLRERKDLLKRLLARLIREEWRREEFVDCLGVSETICDEGKTSVGNPRIWTVNRKHRKLAGRNSSICQRRNGRLVPPSVTIGLGRKLGIRVAAQFES